MARIEDEQASAAARIAPPRKAVSIAQFGKDHWSLLAYIETLTVDSSGVPDLRRMRCNRVRHPGLAVSLFGPAPAWEAGYGTRLRNGKTLAAHDDYDCADDLGSAGLIKIGGTGINPGYSLTDLGRSVAESLRRHKATGGSFANFNLG